jgi:methyl-accepting chemotaxis protein
VIEITFSKPKQAMLNLNLKNRILVGYLIPLPLSIVVATLIYSTANKLNIINRHVSLNYDAIKKSDSLAYHAQRIERSTRGYLINKEIRHLEGFQQGKTSFIKEAKQINDLDILKNGELKEIFQKILKTGNQLIELDETMINLSQNGKASESVELFSQDKSSELVRTLYDLHQDFNRKIQQIIQKEQSSLYQTMEFINIIAVLGTALSGIAAVGFGLFIASRLTAKINQSINNIASSSTELATTVEQQERTAAQQAVAVNETTTTMDGLAASSRTSAEQAEAAAFGTKQVLDLVHGNHQMPSSSISGKSSLQERVIQIAEQIVSLSEQTNQIGSISSLVNNLANQTNLLALNAAVEAVRAGEQGKGFAVVAAEIRKLADQSKQSAERINSLVFDIQKATNSTVSVTVEGRKTVEDIAMAINDIAVNSQQISITAKQQAVAIKQVVESMNSINQAASQTANGISQTKISIQKLNDAALDLKTVV